MTVYSTVTLLAEVARFVNINPWQARYNNLIIAGVSHLAWEQWLHPRQAKTSHRLPYPVSLHRLQWLLRLLSFPCLYFYIRNDLLVVESLVATKQPHFIHQSNGSCFISAAG